MPLSPFGSEPPGQRQHCVGVRPLWMKGPALYSRIQAHFVGWGCRERENREPQRTEARWTHRPGDGRRRGDYPEAEGPRRESERRGHEGEGEGKGREDRAWMELE